MKFKEVKPEIMGIIFGVFIIVFYITLMKTSIMFIEHPLFDLYITRILQGRESLIPLSVVVAISLFLVKEFLENTRKYKANNRKLNAYKRLIAEEVKLNFGALQSIKNVCNQLDEPSDELDGTEYEAKFKEAGILYVHGVLDGKLVMCSIVLRVRFEQYDKLLVNIAELNEDFYNSVKATYIKVIELEHLYSGLIKGLQAKENGEPFPSDITKSGFTGYALSEIERIEPELKKLHLYCTGSELTKCRMR